jgi:predicted membrane-bound dolichyl-phosphate-mannose-protein mannosyltransferase
MNGAKWHLKNVGCESSLQQLLFWLITLKSFFINDDKQKLK